MFEISTGCFDAMTPSDTPWLYRRRAISYSVNFTFPNTESSFENSPSRRFDGVVDN